MENVVKVVFEKVELRNGDVVVRLIAFEADPDTGAMSVHDILETDLGNEAGIRWLALKAEIDYPAAEVTFKEGRTLADFDTGRARKLASRIERVIAQLEVEAY